MPLWNGAAGKGLRINNLSRPVTRVAATYVVSGLPVSLMLKSAITPSRSVWPWAMWAVTANPGASGNWSLLTRSCGVLRLRSKNQCFRMGLTGYTFPCGMPSMCHCPIVSNWTYIMAGNVFHISVAGAVLQPTTLPLQPFKMPRPPSRWSVARMGRPRHMGNTPYKPPHSWSWRCVPYRLLIKNRHSKFLLTMLPDVFLDKPSMLIASRPLEEDAPSEVRWSF